MTTFLRLLNDKDKQTALQSAVRYGGEHVFEVDPASFCQIPGAPFAYWVNHAVRDVFCCHPPFEGQTRTARQGLATADDFRFLRTWWEVIPVHNGGVLAPKWYSFAKGGVYSPVYADLPLVVNWEGTGREIDAFARSVIRNPNFYILRPGLTWPLRTQGGLSLRAMPVGGIFGHKGPAAFVDNDDPDDLLALLAITNSHVFRLLVSLQMAFGSYEVGVIQKTPVPLLTEEQRQNFAILARRAWSLKRTIDTVNETSHAFVLPGVLRARIGNYELPAIEVEVAQIEAEIDTLAFDLYGFSESDRQVVHDPIVDNDIIDAKDDEDAELSVQSADALLSWAVGVAFGRFDWRLATGERNVPPEPQPFDPLPLKSPGMLPDGAKPFHKHLGILVDDPGHQHDLPHLVQEVLASVEVAVPEDVRGWLRRDFFPFHLQCYSKNRRKAPIYWPLATVSGNYTLWIYYPSLSSQTLYTAINDFVEPKLKQVGCDTATLQGKGTSRSRDDEKLFESLQALEIELIELRDSLLKLAPTYKPSQDDGVQIAAAPLWALFSHKPWQKVLKETCSKLESEQGEYDWAHLSMNYFTDRVRARCKTDKSIAIAHGLDHLYVEPKKHPPENERGWKKSGGHK